MQFQSTSADQPINLAVVYQSSSSSRFQMILTEPIHNDGGGLIDHVYLGNSFMKKKQASSLMRNIYFSDYDAFKCKIYLNPIFHEGRGTLRPFFGLLWKHQGS